MKRKKNLIIKKAFKGNDKIKTGMINLEDALVHKNQNNSKNIHKANLMSQKQGIARHAS